MMRNRTTSLHPHRTADSDDDPKSSSSKNAMHDDCNNGSIQEDSIDKKQRMRQQSFLMALVVLVIFGLFWMFHQWGNTTTRRRRRSPLPPDDKMTKVNAKEAKPDWSLYENCTLPSILPNNTSYALKTTMKPIFTPSFPNSLNDQILRNIVNSLTGAPATVKAYYAQSRKMGLRHCYGGGTRTILCTLIHPLVPLTPSPDTDKYTSRFHSTVIMPLRNPATVFPAFLQSKAEKYHQQIGQVPIEQWRHQRDESLMDLMQQYRRQITEWNNNKLMNHYYHTALYLPYEHIMDPTQGPQLVQKLARVLQQSGFDDMISLGSIDSLTEQDHTCIWYHSVGANWLQAHHDSGYAEYPDGYFPSYTALQYQYMAQELEELMQESSQDLALVQILQEYRNALEHPTHIDVVAEAAAE